MDFKDVSKIVTKMTNPMKRRISLMVGRAVLSAAADDTKTFQTLQLDVLSDETLDGLERFQNYGFTSVPVEGAEALVVFPQGNRDHGIVVAVDDRKTRMKGLLPGDVAMYSRTPGRFVKIREADGQITLETDGEMHLHSFRVELGFFGAEAVIKGEIFQVLFNDHLHTDSNGYATTPPNIPLVGAELSTNTFTD